MAVNVRRFSIGVCALGFTLALGVGAPASAAPYPNPPGQHVGPSGGPTAAASAGARSVAPTAKVAAGGGAAAQENLPFTGQDVIEIVAVGLGAAAAGTAAVTMARSRRRRPEPHLD